MEIRAIGAAETKALYDSRLQEDFPPDELRPYSSMRRLQEEGLYHCFICSEGEDVLGYAFFLVFNGYALLDYYAVSRACRGQGIGTKFLSGLKRAVKALPTAFVLIEAESMEGAETEAQREERARRFRFYEGCGCRKTNVYSLLFGVEYRILLFPVSASPEDREVLSALENLYGKMLPSVEETTGPLDREKICRCFTRHEKKPREYERELGRAITYLNQSRKRFMGERLREYGFSGAMYSILLHVNRHPGTTQDNIATYMYIDKSNVARRIKQLEELGYIRREVDAADRRQNNLYLTESGATLVPVIREYLSQWVRNVTKSLSGEERERLLELLLKIIEGEKAS